MADRKITDFLTQSALKTNTLFAVVDPDEAAAADQNKKIAVSAMFTTFEPTFTKNTAFNKNFGGTGAATTVARSDHNHSGVYQPAFTLASLAAGDLAYYNGSKWINNTPELNWNDDVSWSPAPALNDFLRHNGTKWTNDPVQLSYNSDISFSTLAAGDAMYYNGSLWTNLPNAQAINTFSYWSNGGSGNNISYSTGTVTVGNTFILTSVASDAGFATSQLLSLDSSGNVDKIAASGGGTTNFLRADGTWAAPPGGGVTAPLTLAYDAATTNNVEDVLILQRNSTGTPGNNIGTGIEFGIETSTTVGVEAGRIQTTWDIVAHASREASISLWASEVGTMRKYFEGGHDTGTGMFAYDATRSTSLQIGATTSLAFVYAHYTTSTSSLIGGPNWHHGAIGTVANGFGVNHSYTLESSTGTVRPAVYFEYSWINATDASRSAKGEWSVFGTTETTLLTLSDNSGNPQIVFGRPIKPYGYTAASLPTASTYDQHVLFVTDEETLAYSNGTTWRRIGVVDGGFTDDNPGSASLTVDCGNQQQYKESFETDDTTSTWTISNFGGEATLFILQVDATDKTLTLSATGMVFVNMASKVAITAAASTLALTIPGGVLETHEINLVDTGLTDSGDRVIHVIQV